MIKFFRKIRQKLLTENKFSKYLIYAIGEIILVVIGILIALQLNNWNTDKALNGGRLMIPNNYEALKNDKKYLYFLRSQKDQLYWYVRTPLKNAKKRGDKFLKKN